MGNRLQELGVSRRLTQKVVSQIIGTSQQNLSRYEKNVMLVPTDILIKLSKYYNVTTDYILGLSNMKKSEAQSRIKDQDALEFIEVYQSVSKKNKDLLWHIAIKLREDSVHSK